DLRRLGADLGPCERGIEGRARARVAQVLYEPPYTFGVCVDQRGEVAAIAVAFDECAVHGEPAAEARVDPARVRALQEVKVVGRPERWVIMQQHARRSDPDALGLPGDDRCQ